MHSLRQILLIVAVVCGVAASLAAQIQYGEFSGTVTDPTDAVIADVILSIRNVDTGLTIVTKTNRSGIYAARYLLPGSYAITAEAATFAKDVRRNLLLNAGTVQ